MAKKGSVNRTEKVQEYLSQHPDESISEVLSGLKRQGIQVSRSLVSQVRKKLGLTSSGRATKKSAKKKAKRQVAKKKVASSKTVATGSTARSQIITAEDLYEAKKLADELGGIERLREALDAIERLR